MPCLLANVGAALQDLRAIFPFQLPGLAHLVIFMSNTAVEAKKKSLKKNKSTFFFPMRVNHSADERRGKGLGTWLGYWHAYLTHTKPWAWPSAAHKLDIAVNASPCHPTPRKWKQEDGKFRVLLGYRTVWDQPGPQETLLLLRVSGRGKRRRRRKEFVPTACCSQTSHIAVLHDK